MGADVRLRGQAVGGEDVVLLPSLTLLVKTPRGECVLAGATEKLARAPPVSHTVEGSLDSAPVGLLAARVGLPESGFWSCLAVRTARTGSPVSVGRARACWPPATCEGSACWPSHDTITRRSSGLLHAGPKLPGCVKDIRRLLSVSGACAKGRANPGGAVEAAVPVMALRCQIPRVLGQGRPSSLNMHLAAHLARCP